MAAEYKLPLCWVGHPRTAGEPELVQPEDCNQSCHCTSNPMQAIFCMEGHMTECHAGMSCEEAQCSHYLRLPPDVDYI